jgi:hypothetical protein
VGGTAGRRPMTTGIPEVGDTASSLLVRIARLCGAEHFARYLDGLGFEDDRVHLLNLLPGPERPFPCAETVALLRGCSASGGPALLRQVCDAEERAETGRRLRRRRRTTPVREGDALQTVLGETCTSQRSAPPVRARRVRGRG